MNNKGFTTISLILFLPMLFALFTIGFFGIWTMNNKNSIQNICHEASLESQEALVRANAKILKLNKKAKLLYTKKKILNAIILVAPPQIKIPAIQKRNMVIAQQHLLKAKQKGIRLFGESQSKFRISRVRRKMNRKARSISRKWNASWSPKVKIQSHWSPSQLKVLIPDIAPVYFRAPGHSTSQMHSIYWSLSLKRVIPNWITKQLKYSPELKGKCFSHPHQGGYQWIASIGKGKHL